MKFSYLEVKKKIDKILKDKKHSDILDNIIDILYSTFEKYNWIGIYFVKGDFLSLGPWRGENQTEHTKISIGAGICGSAAKTGKTELIPNVNQDNRYLSCFVSTKSELVVPIKHSNKIIAEIDIDSNVSDAFTAEDVNLIEEIAKNEHFINIILQYL
jgi:L-methionine (R)-S-oxide reductase